MEFQSALSQIDFTAILNNLAVEAVNVLLAFLVVAVFVVIGLLVAAVINKILRHIFERVKLEEFLEKIEITKALRGYTVTGIITALVKVYVLLAFLGAAAALVQLPFLTTVIDKIIIYIPMVIQGILILIGAVVITHYKRKVINETKIPFARQIAMLSTGLLLYIALLLALPLILPNVDISSLVMILETFMMAVFVAVALGFGLAIGLGLKEPIAKSGLKHQKLFDSLFEKIEGKEK